MKWGFKKAFLHCALLLIAGAVFQFILGGTDKSFLKHPWGPVIAVNYLYLLILGYAKSDSWTWVKRLYDRHSMVASLTGMTVLCIILGLFNFRHMTSSWPFCLMYLHFTTVLGLRTIDDIRHWRHRRFLPLLSHAAVFLVLAAGMFSSGEKTKIRVTAAVGYPVHTGIDISTGKEAELPFSIVLKDFTMEEYPSKLHIIEYRKGTSSEEYLSIVKAGDAGTLDGWQITATQVLDMAGCLRDSLEYREMDHVGATTAVYIRATATSENGSTETVREGWVSCGSHIFPPAMLQLNDTEAIAMPSREPSRYLSEVVIADSKGQKDISIEVNRPGRIGHWRIYQQGYDTERGRWSTISVFECVKDGWYPIVRTALWMILACGILMALTAGIRNGEKTPGTGNRNGGKTPGTGIRNGERTPGIGIRKRKEERS